MSLVERSTIECPMTSLRGLPLLLIIWQGGKAVSLEYGEGLVNSGEGARRFGVSVMQTGEWPHRVMPDLYLFSMTEQTFLPIMILNTLKSTLGH